jgi:polyisoprenoid-binding protein YceI
MKILKLIALFFITNTAVFGQTYIPTDAGSKVHFVIKNFGAKTGGDFTGLKGSIVFDPKNLTKSNFNVSVNSTTINTDNSTRDKHLRKSEYFNVDAYPLITIISTKISESTMAGRYFFAGNLTIKGVTKVIEFGFSATPSATGYVFNGEFEINRRDYGVGGSSFSMSDNLKVSLDILANK